MDIKDQMLGAKNLIQQRRYDEARAILKTIQHPTSQKWLAKLEQIHPEKKSESPKRRRVWLIVGGIVGLLIIWGLIYNTFERSQTPALIRYIDTIETNQTTVCSVSFIDGLRDPSRYRLCMDISTNFGRCADQTGNTAEVLSCLSIWNQQMCSLIYLEDESGKSQCQAEASATATANAAPK